MDLNKIWVKDPKTGEDSVSLSLVVISFLVCLFAMVLEMTGVISNTSMTFELFGATCGLYWGRKWTSSKGQKIE